MNNCKESRYPEFALYWTKELGFEESSLIRLTGGINNQVYKCGAGQFCVIKGYAALKPGLQDRMEAEVEFLHYATQVAPGFTPALIHVDHDRRCIVLEHLEGEKFTEGKPPPVSAVTCAVRWFRQLNSDQTAATELIGQHAAEGFLRLTEHLANIKYRLAKMGNEHLPAATKAQAKGLLATMNTRYAKIREGITEQITSGRLIDSVQLEDCCISPGDFGFHNAIATSEGVKFFDFEFAGWDDPAKTAIDFILQPRIPVKQDPSPLLTSLSARQSNILKQRYEALLPVLHLKWCCIILSVLNPVRLREMILTNPNHKVEELVSSRIIAASSYLRRSYTGQTSLP